MTPRILVLATFLEREQAGAAHATINIVNALARRHPGGIVLCAFVHDRALLAPDVRVMTLAPTRSRRFFWRFPTYFFLRQCFARLRDAGAPRALLCYTQNTCMALAYRRLYPDVPIVSHTGPVLAHREYMEEGTPPPLRAAIEGRVIRHLERRSYQQPLWRHIVSTNLVASQRAEHFDLPDGFFTVCPLGIDLDRFQRSAAHEDMRSRYGVPRDAFLLVTVARLVRWKNVDMILRCLSRATSRPWLFVVGSGDENERLRMLASALNIDDRVRFVGHADPAPFLACGDLFVLPSSIESFGMAYAEAMSMGLPCIGLRNRPPDVLSSASDVIPEGKAGFCVAGEAELGEKVDYLAANRSVTREMGEFAFRLATSRYTADEYADRLDSLVG